jgi:hypothetical protein
VKLPVAVGLKVTEILQLAPASSVVPQPLVSANALAPAPVIETAMLVSVAVPGFESSTTWTALVVPLVWLPKDNELGASTACGEPDAPVPLRLTVCGLLESLSVRVSVPVIAPVAVGVKVTSIVQLEFAASDGEQSSVSANEGLATMLVKVMADEPEFCTVMV